VARAGVARQRMYSRRGLGPQPRDLGVRPPGAPRAGQEQRPYVPCSWERGPTFCNSARAQLGGAGAVRGWGFRRSVVRERGEKGGRYPFVAGSCLSCSAAPGVPVALYVIQLAVSS
jgi:hypothetical protein